MAENDYLDNETEHERPVDLGMRVVRRLTGVHEQHLASLAPGETVRFNGIAWTMLGTAAMAFVGMYLVVQLISDLNAPISFVLALGWSLFVLAIDYSVVSAVEPTTTLWDAEGMLGSQPEASSWLKKARRLKRGRNLVRLLMGLVLGLAIGESIVLAAFGTQAEAALDEEQIAERQEAICAFELTLVTYRPETQPFPRCGEWIAGFDSDFDEARAATQFVSSVSVADSSAGEGVSASGDLPEESQESANTANDETAPELDALQNEVNQLQGDFDEVTRLVAFWNDVVQCESQPLGYSEARRQELGCSGVGGDGPGWTAARETRDVHRSQLDRLTARLDNRNDELTKLRLELVGSRAAADKDAAEAQAELEAERQKAEQEAQRAADTRAASDQSAVIAEREDWREARNERRNSERAINLAASIGELRDQIARLEAGESLETYGLSERFRATEQHVDPWIKWGVRIVVVLVDLAPLLLKVTLPPSMTDIAVARDLRLGLLAIMRPLIDVGIAEQDHHFAPVAPTRDGYQRRGADPPSQRATTEHSAGDEAKILPIGALMVRLLDPIGRGGFSTVYRAEVLGIDRFEADYSLVVKQRADTKAAQQALEMEHNIYQQNIPGLPRLIEGDKQALLLQGFPRTSIDRWLFEDDAHQRFSLADLLGWTKQLARTLGELWSRDVVHGDGKPGNIVVTGPANGIGGLPSERDGEVRIIDFGSSAVLGSKHLTASSPGYIPPEAFVDGQLVQPIATPLNDIYSMLGSTLYYLASGGVDPWADQVESLRLLRTEQESSGPASDDWVRAQATGPVTPLQLLNPTLPDALVKQIEVWMSVDPMERLSLEGHATPESGARSPIGHWNVEWITERLRRQIQTLETRLHQDVGDVILRAADLGERHPRAISPENLPDLSFELPTQPTAAAL